MNEKGTGVVFRSGLWIVLEVLRNMTSSSRTVVAAALQEGGIDACDKA
jgi:hypothetical protein